MLTLMHQNARSCTAMLRIIQTAPKSDKSLSLATFWRGSAMVSHLFYYQLALLAIVWLFVMLHVAGSRRGAQIPRSATPIKPRRNRSSEPKAFEGLTHKPHCDLVERETPHPKPPSPVPPDPMALTNRRPR